MTIAYQVIGSGPIDLVVISGWISNLEIFWEQPDWACFTRRLASFARVILLDKRGNGLSDRVAEMPTLEVRMDDLRAVMDAAGSVRSRRTAMDAHDAASIRKQTKVYMLVFGGLMVLTLITVGIAYLHLSPALAVVVALLVAAIKGTLVAGYFMHLLSERKTIYMVLLLTVVFFAVLMAIPTLNQWDQRAIE